MRGSRDRLVRATLMGACALAFVLLAGAEYTGADTRLIAHFEDDGGGDPYGRDVLAEFYDSQTAAPEDNLFPNSLTAENLAPFPLVGVLSNPEGDVSGDPFEIWQFDSAGGNPGLLLIGEERFAAFGSGRCLGAQDQLEDFHISFINVEPEDNNDDEYRPGVVSTYDVLDDNPDPGDASFGDLQDWSTYDYLCFYICINASDIPDQQFFDDFTIQLWEYWVELHVDPVSGQLVVDHNEREIFEVSLGDYVGLGADQIPPFTGWKHIRIPLADFELVPWDASYWRYGNYVSQSAYDAPMSRSPDWDHIRAIIFRKGLIEDPPGTPTEPPDRVTVAIDEIVVTGDTDARVARINIPGYTTCSRRDDHVNGGLCWAQLFDSHVDVDNPAVQGLPYTDPVQPWPPNVANDCIDVTFWVRDWQDLNATFSAEVDKDAEVADDDFSSEIVFVPQFQAPGTWVERWGGDFSRRKGTMILPALGFLDERFLLFYTDWRYDYGDGVAAENYLVHYDPSLLTPAARLAPSDAPEGGFIANYFREYGYAYGTLFVLPRDGDGNIGHAEVIDVLFRTAPVRTLHHDRLTTGLP